MKTNLSLQNQDNKKDIVFSLLKEKVETGKVFDCQIGGNSMLPLIEIGDIVSVRYMKFQNLRKGDILLYRTGDYLCVHRYIIRANPGQLIVKGDNARRFDQLPILREQLIGKVISIRKNGKIINLETAPWEIVNYLLGNISAVHAYIPLSLQLLRKTFLPNKEFPYGRFIDSGLSLLFSFSLRLVICLTKILPWFYKT